MWAPSPLPLPIGERGRGRGEEERMSHRENTDHIRREEWVELYRKSHSEADRWAEGYGPIKHEVETQARIFAMAQHLSAKGIEGGGMPIFDLLYALDHVTSAALWIVVHETYA